MSFVKTLSLCYLWYSQLILMLHCDSYVKVENNLRNALKKYRNTFNYVVTSGKGYRRENLDRSS